jgi:hypothetical protein
MVTPDTSATFGPMVTVPRAQVAAQILALGLPRNTLSAAFDLPESGEVSASWPTHGPEEQATLQVALPLLASPALVARARAVLDDGLALATWIVTGSSNDPALTPYLLLAHDEKADSFRMRVMEDRQAVARTFLPYLDAGLPATESEAFELPVEAFALLVALCDLQRRARFGAGLDHVAVPQQFTAKDIELALADAREHGDVRWVLPHVLAIRPDLPAAPDLARGLAALAAGGWVVSRTAPVSLSESGARLARALDQRLALLSFWVAGATPEGELASRSSLFVRSPWEIWCFDVGGVDGRAATGAAVDVATAYGLLQDLLTPVGVPWALQAVQPAGEGRAAGAETPGDEAEGPAPAGRHFCPHCGQPVGSTARFCGSCGQSFS